MSEGERRGRQRAARWLRAPRRLRFTREGKYFVALTLGIGFAAVNTGNNLIYLLLGTMLGLIIASGILSEVALRGLRITRQPPTRIYANRPFLMGFALHNVKRRLPSFSLEIGDLWTSSRPGKTCFFLKLPAGKTQMAAYRHVLERRGQHLPHGIRVSTKFPFALFDKSRVIHQSAEVLVYPEVTAVTSSKHDWRGLGEQAHGRAGRRGEFHALRDYREGDDPRDIFWRKSARTGRTVVREHEDPRSRCITIFLDNRCERAEPTADEIARQEQAVSDAASLAVHHLNRGNVVALITRTSDISAAAGPAQVDRLLTALALVQFMPASATDEPPLPRDHVWVGATRPSESRGGLDAPPATGNAGHAV